MTNKSPRRIMRFLKKSICCAVALTTLLCTMPTGIIQANAAAEEISVNNTTIQTISTAGSRNTNTDNWYYWLQKNGVFSTGENINLCNQTGPIAISLELVHNGTMKAFRFGTGGSVSLSADYDCSSWEKGSIHNITFVFYPDTRYSTAGPKIGETYNIKSDLYVDNGAVQSYSFALKNGSSSDDAYKFDHLRFHAVYTKDTSWSEDTHFTVNSVKITNKISGDITTPSISTKDNVFTISGATLYSKTRVKVSAITANYTNAKVYKTNGTEASPDDELLAGMKIKLSAVYDTVSIDSEYTYGGRSQAADISVANPNYNKTFTTLENSYHGGAGSGQMYTTLDAGNSSINFFVQKNPVAISMEVSSKGKLEKLFLGSSQACQMSPIIDTSAWKADEKHSITLVVYPDANYLDPGTTNGAGYSGTYAFFLDEKPVESGTWGQRANMGAASTYHYAHLRFVWKYLADATDSEKAITIHSFNATNKINDKVSRPSFQTSGSGFALYKGNIYGYTGKNVSDLVAANPAYTTEVYSGNTKLSNSAALAGGQTVVLTKAYDTVSLSQKYTLANSDTGIFTGEIKSFSNGYLSDKFAEGTFKIETDLSSYSGAADLTAYLAQYDYAGRLITHAQKQVSVSQGTPTDLSISIDLSKSLGTTLKFMIWDNDMKPIMDAVEFEPYSSSELSVVPVYPNWTNKAATFRFDDGISADTRVIESLNKFGAKSTFYAVGGWQGNSAHYMGYDATATDKVNWTKFKNAYNGHEVGNHTLNHTPAHLEEGQTGQDSHGTQLTGVSATDLVKAVNDNQDLLKNKTDIITRGIAWPNSLPFARSDWNAILEGIKKTHDYSISTDTAINFDTPKDWYQWQTNAYLTQMTEQTDKFIADDETSKLRLFYGWGHAYEVGSGDSQEKISTTDFEASLKKLKDADVWFATNSEIYDYVNAIDGIKISEKTIKNPSNQTVYLYVNGKNVTIEPNSSYTPTYGLTIACWGDSLTYGQGSTNESTGVNAYPAILERMTGAQVYNMGIGGETSMTIAARQGAVDFTVASDFTIPASGSVNILSSLKESASRPGYYYFPVVGIAKGEVVPRNPNIAGWKPVTINGVEGTFSLTIGSGDEPRLIKTASFTRTTAGNPVEVKAGNLFTTSGESVNAIADVNVFFTGTNGGFGDSEDSLIELIKTQINATKDPSKYVIIGLTSKDTNAWSSYNTKLASEFGEHFIDAKAYFTSEQALIDAGISVSDVIYKTGVAVPLNFLVPDGVHFNDTGYNLLAGLVYNKLVELNYVQ